MKRTVNKRVSTLTLKLTEAEAELLRKAGEALYGKGHPVRPGVVARELALWAARRLLKGKKVKV